MVPGSAASPGNLREVHTLIPLSRPTQSETLSGAELSVCVCCDGEKQDS